MSDNNRLTLVQIQTALLVPVTANFVEDKLGVKAAESEKRAKFWTQAQYQEICQKLIAHVTAARNADFAAIVAAAARRS